MQKTFTVDFLQKKIKINEGEVPQYYVENSHAAIIDPEEWERVQLELARRKTAIAALIAAVLSPESSFAVTVVRYTVPRSGILTASTDEPSGSATGSSVERTNVKHLIYTKMI